MVAIISLFKLERGLRFYLFIKHDPYWGAASGNPRWNGALRPSLVWCSAHRCHRKPGPRVFWLLILPRLAAFLTSLSNPLGSLLLWRSRVLRERVSQKFQRYGPLALTVLVAVPLPITGVWTGCLAAWTFGIPFWRALPPIALGAGIAGVIVTGLTALGVFVAS